MYECFWQNLVNVGSPETAWQTRVELQDVTKNQYWA